MTAEKFYRALVTLDSIKNITGKIEMLNILNKEKDNEALKQIFLYTYDPFRVYHVDERKLFKYAGGINIEEDSISFQSAYDNLFNTLDMMSLKGSTSDADINVLRFRLAFLNAALNVEDLFGYREFIDRIILKDILIGVGVTTINKVWPGLVPTFNVQLASPMEKTINEPCFIEPKYDGARCITIVDIGKGSVKQYTRNGKQINDYDQITKQCYDMVAAMFRAGDVIVLDGEIKSENFDSTMNYLFSKSSNKRAMYYVFDILQYDEFIGKVQCPPLTQRKSHLLWLFTEAFDKLNWDVADERNVVEQVTYKRLKAPVSMADVEDLAEILVADGFEGAMVKEEKMLYNPACKSGFRAGWHKYKFMQTIDAEVVGWEYGTGRLADTMGRITVEIFYDKAANKIYGYGDAPFSAKSIKVGVGSGFSDEQRARFERGENCSVVEIKYQEHTKDGSLRFPVFVCERPDKE